MSASDVDGPCNLIDFLDRVAVTAKNTVRCEGLLSVDATAGVISVTTRESSQDSILCAAMKSLSRLRQSFTCLYEIGVST